jgi:hypothetical protein
VKTDARDFDAKPYSPDEARVAAFLCEAGAGGGDDPIGFILASHAYMAFERNGHRDVLKAIANLDPPSAASRMAREHLSGEGNTSEGKPETGSPAPR